MGELEIRTSSSIMAKRFFNVQCIENVESLTISFKELDDMKKEFTGASKIFVKEQLKQAVTVIHQLLIMVNDLNSKKTMPAEKDQMDEEKEFFFDDCAVS